MVVLVAAGLVAIIGMAGLALDLGDSYLSKTRLQNALDAAALSGAKTLNGPGATTTANAQADAIATFNQDPEMVSAGLTPVIQFSATLNPFAPGATEVSTPPARYVRARVDSYPRNVWFAAVLGINDRAVSGTAVSGPIPLDAVPPNEVCGLAPIMMCGQKEAGGAVDSDCTDGTCYGYDVGTDADPKETVLKTHSQSSDDWEVGPGNFQLLDLGCPDSGGAACVRDNLARGSACIEGDSVATKPGNTVGPVRQGFNTRFGEKSGPLDPFDPDCNCKPDTVIDTDFSGDVNNFWYSSNYKTSSPTNGFEPPIGESGRRVLTVPIGNCDGTVNGAGDVEVLAYGCFFMTRPAPSTGGGNTQELYGQFITECDANAAVVTNPPPGCPGGGCPLFKIVLYKDPDTNDS